MADRCVSSGPVSSDRGYAAVFEASRPPTFDALAAGAFREFSEYAYKSTAESEGIRLGQGAGQVDLYVRIDIIPVEKAKFFLQGASIGIVGSCQN